MKATIFIEEIKAVLPKVARILPTKASLPVLENIHLSVTGSFLTLSCTDLEIGAKFKMVVKSEEGGLITIPGRLLNDFVSALTGEKASFETKEDSLLVRSEGSEAIFVGIDATEYPEMPTADQEPLLTLPRALLSEATGYISFASSSDSNRPVLTGVLIEIAADKLSLVATDGYRLSVKTFPTTAKQDLNLIIPSRFLVEANRLFGSGSDEEVNFIYDRQRSLAVLKNEEIELSSRLIEGQFPPYSNIVPASFVTRTVFNKEDLNNALRLIAVFSRDSGNIARLNFSPEGGVSVSSNASQVGSSKARFKASVEGEEVEVAFNIRYLSDFLASCKSSQVILELSGKIKPALFQEMGNETYKHIIMPVKMQN